MIGGVKTMKADDRKGWPASVLRVLAVFLWAGIAGGTGQARAACADVALVLAVDVSGSITDAEFAEQVDGYVAALTSDVVLASFAEAGVVDLAAVFWADSAFRPSVVPWQRVTGRADALAFAAALRRMGRIASGNTDIGVGIRAALDLFDAPGRCAYRQVIDVSGDGEASTLSRRRDHVALAPVRLEALEKGVVINGLAIATREPELADYYRENVAGGFGAFVLEVRDMGGFAEALSQKLRKELLAHRIEGHPCALATGAFRCLPG